MSVRLLSLMLAGAGSVAGLACVDEPTIDRAFCFEDSDCGDGLSCVVDLTQGASYCAPSCTRDSDCPASQQCQTGVPSSQVEEPSVSVCVDRIRTCQDVERCNGLDDDCDGVVDGPGCQPISPCLDDAPCGLFVCSAPPNQPSALCVPPMSEPRVADFEACTADTDCRNGVCEIGRCAPLCRPPLGGEGGCAGSLVCAEGVGPGLRPPFNQCQTMCVGPADCSDPQICAWRAVFQGGGDHHSVCAIPDPARKQNGAFCAGRTPEIDDECQSGLCFGEQCTRICGGPGSPCGDVSPTAQCCLAQLLYGVSNEYFRYVCVEPDQCD